MSSPHNSPAGVFVRSSLLLVLVACSQEEEPLGRFPLFLSIPAAEEMRSVPVLGGTLESVPAIDGLVSADPEGNVLRRYAAGIVDTLDLGPNARPFRIYVEDLMAWVTLRGTGELALVDLSAMSVVWRTPVCGEVRGVGRSPMGPIVVACAEGTIVEVDDDGEVLRTRFLRPDLRDVVGSGSRLYVSRFTTANVLEVEPTQLWVEKEYDWNPQARVAWRMRDDPMTDEGVVVLHETVSLAAIPLAGLPPVDEPSELPPPYYPTDTTSTPCGRIHESGIMKVSPPYGEQVGADLEMARLATDFAVAPDGSIAFSAAGAGAEEPEVVELSGVLSFFGNDLCVSRDAIDIPVEGRPSSVAYDASGNLYLQTSAPFGLFVADSAAPIVTSPPDDTTASQALFHEVTASGVACASCHPEGLEDATVWTFVVPNGPVLERRTMSLAGSLLSRQPYHWSAHIENPDALMRDTFTTRMGGEAVTAETTEALFTWLDGLRRVRGIPLVTDGVVALGRAAFERANCDSCHTGEAFTNNRIEDVRPAKEAVKTPSLLGVGTRSYLFHDGCAESIEERFEPRCDNEETDHHGALSELSSLDIDALTAYLRTL